MFLAVSLASILNRTRLPYRGKPAQMYWQFCQFTHKLLYSIILPKSVH